jgi:uncharacterized SAM-binding protein YcdF (DUF218 family)
VTGHKSWPPPRPASSREKFLATVLTQPLNRADAIVALCGEDSVPRCAVAQQLLIQGAAPKIVLSGGLDDGNKKSAKTMAGVLMGKGVLPSRIIEDNASSNTKEQAENVLDLADRNGWRRLLLVASTQHLPRAFLTFVSALSSSDDMEALDIRIIPVAANQVQWWGKPEGMTTTRLALLDTELKKIEQYQKTGDVASYEEGLEHLQRLES